MADQNSKIIRNLDGISTVLVVVGMLAVLILYLLFYAPAIVQGVETGVLPAEGILWLKNHIASYWISYILLFAGLLLAIVGLAGKAATRFPWIETVTITATALAVVGLITGIFFSKAAWNAWWVWDAKTDGRTLEHVPPDWHFPPHPIDQDVFESFAPKYCFGRVTFYCIGILCLVVSDRVSVSAHNSPSMVPVCTISMRGVPGET